MTSLGPGFYWGGPGPASYLTIGSSWDAAVGYESRQLTKLKAGSPFRGGRHGSPFTAACRARPSLALDAATRTAADRRSRHDGAGGLGRRPDRRLCDHALRRSAGAPGPAGR